MTLPELKAEMERAVAGLVIEQKRLRPRVGSGIFVAGASRFIAGQSALRDAMSHFAHLLFVGLASDLEEQ